jgi:hypothetical protein
MAADARGIPVERRWSREELARQRIGGMTLIDPGGARLATKDL